MTALLIYAAVGFIAWDFNPANWRHEGRLYFVLFAGVFSGWVAIWPGWDD